MGRYRFAGIAKEINFSAKATVVKFSPDQEFSTAEECNGKKVKYAVFLPFDAKCEGLVFTYADKVEIMENTGKKHAWIPTWEVGTHYECVLESVGKGKDWDLKITLASKSKCFLIESIAERV